MSEFDDLVEVNKAILSTYSNIQSDIPVNHAYWENKSRLASLSKEPVLTEQGKVEFKKAVEESEEPKTDAFDFLTKEVL